MVRAPLVLCLLLCVLSAVAFFLSPTTSSQTAQRSLSLNGSQYVSVPSSTSLNISGVITVEAWIKLNSINGSYQTIVSREAFQQAGTGGGYRLAITDVGKLRLDLFQSHNTYTTAIGATVLSTGVWHHVAGVFDGSQMRVYLNGVLNGSVSTTLGPTTGTGSLYLGRFSNIYNPSYFNGLIDEARVSAAVLYTGNFTPGLGPASNTRGYWKFDGQTTQDSSNNNNHGTVQNGAGYSSDIPPLTNSAPSVSLTHPLNNTSFAPGSSVVFNATASDSDGSIAKVEFFAGTTLLGTDTSAPYSFIWSNVQTGSYSLTAKATDSAGAATTSSPIALAVIAPSSSHSLSLNGNNQYATVPNSPSINIVGPITVEAWIKLNSLNATYQAIVSREAFQQPGTGGGYRLAVTNLGKLRLDLFQSHNTYTTAIAASTLSTAVWHHVAGVFDGNQIRLYVDGTLDASLSTVNGPASGTGALYIGRFSYIYNPYYFDGLLDEVRVSAAALYTGNFAPGLGPASNTRGLWRFDGQTINDFSGQGNHGTLQAGAYSPDVSPPPGGGSLQRPVPLAGGPYSSQVAQSLQFSSNGSFDPDGAVVSYHWDFGDGNGADAANPAHIYSAPGSYISTLTVTDNAGLSASITAPVTIISASHSRTDPMNQTGGGRDNPLSRNHNWNLPLLDLPGRAGGNLELSLSYNSLVWTRNGNYVSFDDDKGTLGPGFRLGFPVLQPPYFNPETGKHSFLLIGPDGSRTELRQVGTSTLYQAADSSYLLLDSAAMVLRTADGTQFSYISTGEEYHCTQVKDANGNFLTINYTPFGRIDSIVDTLARSIKFNYNSDARLISITQTWNQGSPSQTTHQWATFAYSNTNIQTNFPGLTVSGPSNGSTIATLSRVTLADGSYYDFSFNSWGQVWKISYFAADNHLLNYRSYNLPLNATTAQTDCPRFTERRDWAQFWNGDTDGSPTANEEVVTAYAVPVSDSWTMPDGSQQSGMRAQVTTPDGTIDKIYFIGAAGTASGWRRGLPALVNTFDSGGVLRRQVMTTWTQDNTAVGYELNPRVIETNTYDPTGNRARVQITYQQFTFANGVSCQLPRDVLEYAANASTVLRSTRSDYNTSTVYTNRNIIGLVSERKLYEGDVNNGGVLMSKVGFNYDEAGSIQGADAVQHDYTGYGASFVAGRGNLSSVKRYNVSNTSQFTTTTTRYNTAGAVVSIKDALNHETTIAYSDSFSDGNNSRNTLAYPTSATDADGYTFSATYNFDFGAVTRRQTPLPNVTTNTPGPEQFFTHDLIGRLQQVHNSANGSYTRFVYAASQNRIDTYSTIQEGLGESHSFKITDGLNRVIATAKAHPGSVGGYSGQKVFFDVMGRVMKTSNPTETNASGWPWQWTAAGDDAAAGWVYSEQTFDWRGRPLVTTNPSLTGNPANTTSKLASYSGCGCAGEVATFTDELGRKQKVYRDLLGRTWKTEVLNSSGAVYSATVNTFNARDQLTLVREWSGPEGGSGPYQDTTLSYDNYGRLASKHVPEQSAGAATVYAYNADDTIQSVTDGRNAIANYSYSSRHLVTAINYNGPTGITQSANVTFSHDAAGNRISMTDGLGGKTYSYSQLSQLLSETRAFNDPGNPALNGVTKTIFYDYNIGGQLSRVTDPFNSTINYNHDSSGQLGSITGTSFAGVTTYATNLQYRAWGALKQLTYGNNRTLSVGFNSRLQTSSFVIPNVINKTYEYYSDGALRYSRDLIDDRFDRSYAYDHAARITQALSGAEARGEAATENRPYNQSYSYDPLNNLTSQTGKHWSSPEIFSSNSTFTNNRRDNATYDLDGNLLAGSFPDHLSYTYDVAGRIATVNTDDNANTTRGFDGDGLQVRTTQTTQTNGQPSTQVTYYVRSTVLGGRVLTELNATGGKQRTFVYAGDQVLAWQSVVLGAERLMWEHRDPSNASFRTTNENGSLNDQTYVGEGAPAELDPTGANAELADPYWFSPPPDEDLVVFEPYPSFSGSSRLGVSYSLDGIPIPADEFFQMANLFLHGRFGMLESAARASQPRLLGYSVSYRHAYNRGSFTVDFGLDLERALGEAYEEQNLTRNWLISKNDLNWVFFLEPRDTKTKQNPRTPPCPPDFLTLIAGGAAVTGPFNEAFNSSQKTKVEHGGWVVMNLNGDLRSVLKVREPGDHRTAIQLGYPERHMQLGPGEVIVATFHAHVDDIGPDEGLGGDVDINTNRDRVPGIIIRESQVQTYGPKRGIWRRNLSSRCR